MTGEPRLLTAFASRAYRRAVQPVRALGVGLVRLAWMCIAPLVPVLLGLWRPRAVTNPRRGTDAAPGAPAITPGPAAPPSPAPPERGRPHRPTRGFADRRELPEIECVEVAPKFNERLYPTVARLLQLGPRSKLLDLRAAKVVKLDLFEHLAHAWQAPRGTVPRLGILLDYESWAMRCNVIARKLRPIIDRGVELEIFYTQQFDHLPAWFAEGRVHHNLPAVVEWLRTQWRPAAVWPMVLNVTETLVLTCAEIDDVPELLLELVAIALSFEDGAAQATKHAHTALNWVGDSPSRLRCRALRALATATLRLGDSETALELLETVITTAVLIEEPIEEASALAEIGLHALHGGHLRRAEARFRRAIEILAVSTSPTLRATLHHCLADTLHQQHENDEAARHAAAALALRWNKESRGADEDRGLLARIHAAQPSQLS